MKNWLDIEELKRRKQNVSYEMSAGETAPALGLGSKGRAGEGAEGTESQTSKEWVVCSGYHDKTPRKDDINNRNLFSIVLEGRSPRSRWQEGQFLMRALFLAGGHLLYVCSHGLPWIPTSGEGESNAETDRQRDTEESLGLGSHP